MDSRRECSELLSSNNYRPFQSCWENLHIENAMLIVLFFELFVSLLVLAVFLTDYCLGFFSVNYAWFTVIVSMSMTYSESFM